MMCLLSGLGLIDMDLNLDLKWDVYYFNNSFHIYFC